MERRQFPLYRFKCSVLTQAPQMWSSSYCLGGLRLMFISAMFLNGGAYGIYVERRNSPDVRSVPGIMIRVWRIQLSGERTQSHKSRYISADGHWHVGDVPRSASKRASFSNSTLTLSAATTWRAQTKRGVHQMERFKTLDTHENDPRLLIKTPGPTARTQTFLVLLRTLFSSTI